MKIKIILILTSLFLSLSIQAFASTQKLEEKTEKAAGEAKEATQEGLKKVKEKFKK